MGSTEQHDLEVAPVTLKEWWARPPEAKAISKALTSLTLKT